MKAKTIVAGLLLSLATVATLVDAVDAKRRCPRGYEDVNDVCVPAAKHT